MSILQGPIDDAIYQALNWLNLARMPEERHFQWALASRFLQAAREAEEAGDLIRSQALRVLGGTISMQLTHASQEPFGPMMRMSDGRSLAMEDLGEHDVALLARAAADAPNDWLQARFADVSITAGGRTPPDWRLGQLAVRAYLDYAASVFGTEWAMDGVDEVRRGLKLFHAYCRQDEELWDRYWKVVLDEVPHAIQQNWPGLVFRIADEALVRSKAACQALIPQVSANAAELEPEAPQEAARWFALAHRLHHRLGERGPATDALMAQGEAMVKAAELAAEQQPVLAPMQLSEAINLLRRAKAAPSRVAELKDRLAHYERRSLDHYGHHEHKIDVSDLVAWVEAQMASPNFFGALLRMAFRIDQILDTAKLEQRVREGARRYPLSHLFASTHANSEGAIVAQSPAFDGNDPAAVRVRMVSDAAQHDLHMRASVMVSRAADMLYSLYQPSFQAIREIVEASTLTPPEQAESIARGLHAGLCDDWLGAGVYLIPAMEPFVRAQLKRAGAHTLGMDDNGTQHEKTLGELLEMPAAEEFFGKNLVFELQVHLTEKTGFTLRHSYCHGLMSDNQMRTAGVMSLWWLMWRMILFPWHDHPLVLAPVEHAELPVSSKEQNDKHPED